MIDQMHRNIMMESDINKNDWSDALTDGNSAFCIDSFEFKCFLVSMQLKIKKKLQEYKVYLVFWYIKTVSEDSEHHIFTIS